MSVIVKMFCLIFLVLLTSYMIVSDEIEPRVISQEVIICEGSRNKIECPKDMLIALTSVFYGNSGSNTCGSRRNPHCYEPTALSVVHDKCDKKNSCMLYAHSSVFGDPCPRVTKHLKVGYDCLAP
ncbi:L-rhamnose-binding lectin ELEL-1-like isoform X1 [Aethina tumida]|uniref:L-rhamnose-binding lectin ELEL-1-like isoform X1 n=1 Tax=Aethina tumida TaxID=116153 RepID=UPI002147C95C|nr:L-rhamnose-binding lectin ELEL-1-like isoform X1 [Aethina tumida]